MLQFLVLLALCSGINLVICTIAFFLKNDIRVKMEVEKEDKDGGAL